MGKDLVILVDGSYYVYSVYYAFPSLFNSSGEPTGVIYGVVSILRNVFIKYKPKYMIIVFDAPGRTFRDDLFQDYKLYRKSMPLDLSVQLPVVYKIIQAIGFPVIVVPRVEADDVIGTLTVLFSHNCQNSYIYIFSGDKDMMQLVTSNVFVMNTRVDTLFTCQEVRKKFGVSPSMMIDYLSLLGDHSDNIPGVPGIGIVTTKFLLQHFGGIDVIYQNLEMIPLLVGLRGAKSIFLRLEKYRDLAFLSYELVTIKQDVLLGISSCDDLSIKSLDIEVLMSFFERYEFKRWLSDLSTGKWL
ncbi:5'-3' exonuclease [Blochmannia endosymbiont of Polyrhachis (Hedomyrma) turneri]|uniref:5'-3' exonuclease n=1 Tax=Blochmannia endosymbiont of Polyrhachis (Hedomyrma) turneri TaxID=1505596 RepID=UPI00061A7C0C|nr:5'-3' exonuclease H3TH domain-containing protein [Blochmannia endosymbiont of Polyrhachis (Hedomyrma) turneri]AKC60173.1 DNA polymerase I [Blochmannia endosymbiont of Polyrhachis (Hedomyrma) turneri]